MDIVQKEGGWGPIRIQKFWSQGLFWTMSKSKRFLGGLLLLGCESSLTSQHYACPISLSLGNQSNSAFSSLVKTCEKTVAKSKQIFGLTNRQGQVSQKRESAYFSAAKLLVWMQRRHTMA